jgi:hypothetical protein
MRSVFGYLGAAAVLLIVGSTLWTFGQLEREAVSSRRQLMTLHFDGPAEVHGRFGRLLQYAGGLPWVSRVEADIRDQRVTSRYWLGADDSPEEQGRGRSDAASLLVSANAAFRRTTIDPADPQAIKQLDAVLDRYAEVLKQAPELLDAAYNFEYVTRTRDTLARRQSAPARRGEKRGPLRLAAPAGHTLHGNRGGAPAGMEAAEFKVIVPEPGDERQEQREAGSGKPVKRKG